MRTSLLALALAVSATPALADTVSQPAEASVPAAARGMMLRDANNMRLAPIDLVKTDGSVGIILDSRFVLVPANTLSMVGGKLTTRLTKAELSR
jgi:hypothetical protein